MFRFMFIYFIMYTNPPFFQFCQLISLVDILVSRCLHQLSQTVTYFLTCILSKNLIPLLLIMIIYHTFKIGFGLILKILIRSAKFISTGSKKSLLHTVIMLKRLMQRLLRRIIFFRVPKIGLG